MQAFVHYEEGVSPEYIEAAELAYEVLGNATNQAVCFNARPLEMELPLLSSGQVDSAWIEQVQVAPNTSLMVITARDLGAFGLNFCYGRSAFNQGASIASTNRVLDTTFVGLALHENGHSLGLVDLNTERHDNTSDFVGHCANDCVMQPVNNIQEMDEVVQKVLAHSHTAGFCTECATDLANRY